MDRERTASIRAASIVGAMAAWLCVAGGCGRLGYTPIAPEVTAGSGAGTGGTGGAAGAGGAPLDGNVTAGTGGATSGTGGSSMSTSDAQAGTDSAPADVGVDRMPDGPSDTRDASDGGDACSSCPASGITLTGSTATPIRGSIVAGRIVASCENDGVLIGFEGTQSKNPNQLAIESASGICGTVTFTGFVTVMITESGKLPTSGAARGDPWSRRCPANQVVIGFEGNAAGWPGEIRFRCAPLFPPRTVTVLPVVGSVTGSNFPATDCPADQVARGQDLTANTWLNSIGLLCATPQRR